MLYIKEIGRFGRYSLEGLMDLGTLLAYSISEILLTVKDIPDNQK